MLACAEAMFLIRHPQPFKTSESITGELGRSIWLLWCWPKNVACCCWPIIAPLFYFIIIFLTKVHGNVLALRQKLPQWTETDFLSPILVSFFTKSIFFLIWKYWGIVEQWYPHDCFEWNTIKENRWLEQRGYHACSLLLTVLRHVTSSAFQLDGEKWGSAPAQEAEWINPFCLYRG